MAPLPATLRIGPYRVVVRTDPDYAVTIPDFSDGTLGFYAIHDQTIWLRPKQGPDSLAASLLHECLHVAWFCTGADTELSEKIATTLECVLLSLLRENPALVAFLTERME